MKRILMNDVHEKEIVRLKRLAIEHRRMMLELGHQQGVRLHYGAMFSMVEMVTVLYSHWMNVDPARPDWPDRDRFTLSKGHGAPSLYAALCLAGFFDRSAFQNFRRLDSILQGHPDRNKTPGVDCCTGSLGQGFPVACGMAQAAQMTGASYRVYSLMSDGECNEGSVWEAAQIASNLGLDTLTVLLDRNGKSAFGEMAGRNDIEPLADKWRAFNWHVIACNGHDYAALTAALDEAERMKGKPSVVICHTVKGKGIPYAEQHHVRSNFGLTEEQHLEAMAHLDQLEQEVGCAGIS